MERKTFFLDFSSHSGTTQSTIFWQATPRSPVNFTDVSEERTSSIFRVEQASCDQITACCLFGLRFHNEGGGSTFLRNSGKPLPEYTVSHPRRQRDKLWNEIWKEVARGTALTTPVLRKRCWGDAASRLPREKATHRYVTKANAIYISDLQTPANP
jgi:hypothetical protein